MVVCVRVGGRGSNRVRAEKNDTMKKLTGRCLFLKPCTVVALALTTEAEVICKTER